MQDTELTAHNEWIQWMYDEQDHSDHVTAYKIWLMQQ